MTMRYYSNAVLILLWFFVCYITWRIEIEVSEYDEQMMVLHCFTVSVSNALHADYRVISVVVLLASI